MHEIRIIAHSTTAALDIVEEEFGPETQILHTQKHPRGILMCIGREMDSPLYARRDDTAHFRKAA
jgi:flagellar biosynthesis GTPase FlhF